MLRILAILVALVVGSMATSFAIKKDVPTRLRTAFRGAMLIVTIVVAIGALSNYWHDDANYRLCLAGNTSRVNVRNVLLKIGDKFTNDDPSTHVSILVILDQPDGLPLFKAGRCDGLKP